MALIIQKYGGTSLGNLGCIEKVATKIIQTRRKGDQVVVVVSAMHGETDRLIGLAKSIQPEPPEREYDVLVSTGEKTSMALLCMALMKHGCPARSYSGAQAGIQTNGVYQKARIIDIQCDVIRSNIAAGYVSVIAGFQGVDCKGDINTLGRGGSDSTAVALAAVLEADECQIFTDVEGVYSADPRVVPEAKMLKRIHLEEILEMASMGTKVLQNRSVEYAGKYKVPLRVLSTFTEGPGTLVTFDKKNMSDALVSGVVYNRSQASLTLKGVPDQPCIGAKILDPLAEANIDVDMISQARAQSGVVDFSFTISSDDYQRALDVIDNLVTKIDVQEVVGNDKLGKLSIVGIGMQSHTRVVSNMLTTLGKENINIQMISTSGIKVSVIIDEKYLELGIRALHTAFSLDAESNESEI